MNVSPVLISALMIGNVANSMNIRSAFRLDLLGTEDAKQIFPISAARHKLQQTFSCGSGSVTITTVYLPPLGDFKTDFQVISFQFPGGSKSVKYTYSDKQKSYKVMIGAGFCDSYQQKAIVTLQSGNFGSCDECEWDDYYTPQGGYLGSSKIPTDFGIKNFNYFIFRDADNVEGKSVFECDKKYCVSVISGLRS